MTAIAAVPFGINADQLADALATVESVDPVLDTWLRRETKLPADESHARLIAWLAGDQPQGDKP